MKTEKIVLKLKVKQFSSILQLAESVYSHVSGNVHFLSPSPSMPMLLAGINQLRDAIAKWGPKGNRGSHLDHVNLENSALQLFLMLRTLAHYCENTVTLNVPPGERGVALVTSGFALKRPKTPQGILEMVQDLHHFIARNVLQGHIKLRWKKPLNVSTHTNVKGYAVYRNNVNELRNAKMIATTTVTTVTDAPGPGKWFYWIAPINYMGYGVISHSIAVDAI